ncbi:MAG: pilus assembly protein PilM [Synergistaceae bacterium]|nr:pilus assembly protein PilM [Synergistota bacterium]NLM71212.1 pilus assembly protein PilM [Synergistaceae bacterium]
MVASALFRKQTNKAGLALHEDDLRYLEVEGGLSNLKVVNKLSLPSGGKGVKKNSLANAGELLAPLQALGSRIGGFKTPVALSLPSRDILIRVVDLPELEMDDAREALQWDFEKYFPYSFSDAAVDIAKVDNPMKGEPGMMSVLVAACKLRTVESVMRLAETVKMPLDTIEPENVAMFRSFIGPTLSFPAGYLAVFTGPSASQLILGYRDNGILYRTSLVDIMPMEDGEMDFTPLVREISNTLTFAKNQYRDLLVESIILGGSFAGEGELKDVIAETSGIKVMTADPWGSWGLPFPRDDALNWDAAVGLAVRGLS